MLRFFFGQGWMIGWHLGLYFILLIGVVLPLVAFFPLKSAGEKPDLASPGSFGLVMVIVCAAGLVTLVDSILLCSVARGPWFHKTVFEGFQPWSVRSSTGWLPTWR